MLDNFLSSLHRTELFSKLRRFKNHILLIGLSALLLVGLRFNVLNNSFGQLHEGGDEFHTVDQTLGWYRNFEIGNFRVQEGSRWIVRIFSPVAFYEVSQVMGGNITQGWTSAPDYILSHGFSDKDPNIRQFLHSLRKQSVVLFWLSCLPLLLYLVHRQRILAAYVFIVLLGLNADLLTEQKYMYVEPTMMTGLNFMLGIFLWALEKGAITPFASFVFACVSGFALSCKINIVLFLAWPLLIVYEDGDKDFFSLLKRTLRFLVIVFVVFCLSNFTAFKNAGTLRSFLFDFYSNIWNYAQSGTTEAGLPHFKKAFSFQVQNLLGLFSFAWLPLLALAFVFADRRNRIILIFLAFPTLLTFMSFTSQHIFMVRNFVALSVPVLLVLALGLDIVWQRLRLGRASLVVLQQKSVLRIPLQVMLLGLFIVCLLPKDLLSLDSRTLWISKVVPSCESNVAAFVGALVQTGKYSKVVTVEGRTSNAYAVGSPNEQVRWPAFPLEYPDDQFPGIEGQYKDRIASESKPIVLVRRTAKNYHLTNDIFPNYFAENRQWCDYFVFYGKKS